MRSLRWLVPLAALIALGPAGAAGQGFLPEKRPGDERIELPGFEQPAKPPFELPPAPPPEASRLADTPRIHVRDFHVVGATALSPEEVDQITAPYENRDLTAEDLIQLKNQITTTYSDRGYVNSGAVLPEQQIEDGVVEIQIIEGALTNIEIGETRWFRESYFRDRLEAVASTPLNAKPLQERLQVFQQDPRIRRVQAQLGPDKRPGDAKLDATFEEEIPYQLWIAENNYENPSIGSYTTRIGLGHDNLLGFGDKIWAAAGRSEGLEDYTAGYEIPVNTYDTIVGIDYSFSRSDVIEEPFDPLDIKSTSQTGALRVTHPWLRDQNTELELFGSFEWRQSKTYLLGEPFSFVEGPEDGLARLTVLRLGLDYVERDLVQVIAARSMFSVGLPLLGATEHGGTVPDGRFFSWLGQFQWLRRFDQLWGVQALFRTDVQLSASPLLSLEQFAVGGHSTVRGYRENQLVRDNGLVSSIELRIPVLSDATGQPWVQLAPFFDIGRSWNTNRGEVGPKTLYSAGVGLRLQLTDHLDGQIYWGHAFKDVETPEDHDLQDSGIQFQMALSY